MNNVLLDRIIKDGLATLSTMDSVSYRIDNIILGKSIYTMKDCDTVFSDMNLCLILFEQGYGFSYFQDDIDYDSAQQWVNQDVRDVLKTDIPLYIKVALADAVYSMIHTINHTYTYRHFKGTLRDKATARAQELVRGIPKKSKVVLLGAVAEIIDECNKKDIDLTVLDLESSKIGLHFDKTTIQNGLEVSQDTIASADYVIATGMIFVSCTADDLFEKARAGNYKLILYMETGSNFGGSLIAHGAHKVLSEMFPYYDFHGDTKYIVHQKNV